MVSETVPDNCDLYRSVVNMLRISDYSFCLVLLLSPIVTTLSTFAPLRSSYLLFRDLVQFYHFRYSPSGFFEGVPQTVDSIRTFQLMFKQSDFSSFFNRTCLLWSIRFRTFIVRPNEIRDKGKIPERWCSREIFTMVKSVVDER